MLSFVVCIGFTLKKRQFASQFVAIHPSQSIHRNKFIAINCDRTIHQAPLSKLVRRSTKQPISGSIGVAGGKIEEYEHLGSAHK